ncbi:MAG: benzoate-CoA ligase family protein, partial [Acidobacteriota bacterium]|nr:benzoate-CoA ligase family protein [Acidobacteriota bacterium]
VSVVTDEQSFPRLRFPEPFNAAEFFIDRHIKEGRGASAAIRTLEREVSYDELLATVNRFGNSLTKLGIRAGDRVLIILKDSPEFFSLFWGAVKIGALPVPLNGLAAASDFEFVIRHSKCSAVFYSEEFAGTIKTALAARAPQPKISMAVDGERNSLNDLSRNSSPQMDAVFARAEDDCFCLYSSGTTGLPKGVIHAHGDLAVISQFYTVETLGATEDDSFFNVARLCFSYGMNVGMLGPLYVGGTAILDDRRPTPASVLELFRRCQPTIFGAVPTFYAQFLASGLLGRKDNPRLRRCISAAEALPPELHREWLATTGVPIMEGIGSTEVGHIYISNRVDDIRPGVTGKPIPGYHVRLVDETGNNVPDDIPGRLLVKGQSVLKRYWNDPERTAKAVVDGWYDTGDTFRRDAHGYYTYCGRSDDVFKVSGRWVSPYEIESTLVQHPQVLEAAVISRKDEHGLVHPDAWVVLKDPSNSRPEIEEELRQHCDVNLPRYKLPRWVHVVDKLPKTATGKIQRYKLRIAVAEQDRLSQRRSTRAAVTIEHFGRIAVATLSRPPVNALNDEMIEQLDAALDQAIEIPEIVVLHIRSDQSAFCAGADLALMQSCFGTLEGPDVMLELVRRMQRLFMRIETAPLVTLAEIGGPAMGGGLELALACDIRVAASEAKLGLPEVGLGLLPGAGGTQRLTRLCGRGIAERLILGGEIVDGNAAERLGIVQWVRPASQLPEFTRDLAMRLAQAPRPALAASKRCLAAFGDPHLDGFAEELAATRKLYQHPETRRRVAEFLERSMKRRQTVQT